MDLRFLMRSSYPHERLLAGYFLFLALLMCVAGSVIDDRLLRISWHLALAVTMVTVMPAMGERGWLNTVRHWLPVLFLAVIYTELDVLNDMFSTDFHDEWVIGVEEKLFGTQVAIMFRKTFPNRLLSEYLHLSYFSYYFLFPVLGVALFMQGRRDSFRYAATVTLAAFLLCYTIYIFFPVGGPWNTFTRPPLEEVGTVMPAIVHTVLIKGESVGTAFPSSHVVAALTIWLVALRLSPGVFRFQALLVPGLVLGTMYGGFHYAIDVVLAIPMALAVVALGPVLHRALGGDPDASG